MKTWLKKGRVYNMDKLLIKVISPHRLMLNGQPYLLKPLGDFWVARCLQTGKVLATEPTRIRALETLVAALIEANKVMITA
jgi:hypothetical protein